jgi:hypothetical protein
MGRAGWTINRAGNLGWRQRLTLNNRDFVADATVGEHRTHLAANRRLHPRSEWFGLHFGYILIL